VIGTLRKNHALFGHQTIKSGVKMGIWDKISRNGIQYQDLNPMVIFFDHEITMRGILAV